VITRPVRSSFAIVFAVDSAVLSHTLAGVTNINEPVFDELREQPGFRCKRARVSRQAGSDRLGLSLWELPPGEAAYPYHYHLAEEELVVVLDGRPSLRIPSGWRELSEGEVVPFLRGDNGAHQLVNRTEEIVRFLAFSTNGEPDIVVRPDSGTVGAYERLVEGGGLRLVFREADAVDYYQGEQPPG
jgi:uncharacterized cupin superfamily protein